MSEINFICGIVKILELPKQKNFQNNILRTQVRVQFPQIRNTLIVKLIFWNDLAHDIVNYYKIDDYVLIEGYFYTKSFDSRFSTFKTFNITVLKIYPFKLDYKRLIN